MTPKEEREINRIKELESINLAREEIRDLVIETKKEVEKDNDLLADQINRKLNNNSIKSIDIVGAIGAGKTALLEKLTEKLSKKYKIRKIALSGGVFQNKYLMSHVTEQLKKKKYTVLTNRQSSVNDLNISLGQYYVSSKTGKN